MKEKSKEGSKDETLVVTLSRIEKWGIILGLIGTIITSLVITGYKASSYEQRILETPAQVAKTIKITEMQLLNKEDIMALDSDVLSKAMVSDKNVLEVQNTKIESISKAIDGVAETQLSILTILMNNKVKNDERRNNH